MLYKWKIRAELFWMANREDTVYVTAHTEKKAIMFAKTKLEKKYKTDMIRIISVQRI